MQKYFSYTDDLINSHYRYDERPSKDDFYLHTHEQCELYCFLGGKGSFKIEGNTYPLHIGDILVMAPGEAHYIDLDLSVPYTRFVVHFNIDLFDKLDKESRFKSPFINRESGCHNLYRSADFKSRDYKTYLAGMYAEAGNRSIQVISNLMPFLNELANAFECMEKTKAEDTQISRIIKYIGSRICEDITLEEICNEFYISKPQLCRIFKKATGSTVWEYVTAKRLIMAQGLIRMGNSPTKIFSECGFSDYSVFYRAYKKRYGISPNKT